MDTLRKPFKALLIIAGLLLVAAIGFVLFLFIFLYTPSDVSEEEREAILNIRALASVVLNDDERRAKSGARSARLEAL